MILTRKPDKPSRIVAAATTATAPLRELVTVHADRITAALYVVSGLLLVLVLVLVGRTPTAA